MRGVLDPRICNIHLDANAVDRDGGPRDGLVDRLLGLRQTGKINFVVPGSVRGEVQHPNTPQAVRSAVLPEIFSLPVGKTAGEIDTLRKIRAVLQGNAKPGRHDADGLHLCEAAKYGGGYFITHDARMLKKRNELRPLLGPALLTLTEFLDIYDDFAARRAMRQLEEAHLEEREAEKQDAVAAVEEALARIEQQEREPDQWERVFIAEAIGAVFRGNYGLACTDVALAMTPPSGRSPVPMLPQDPLYDRCNISLLCDALREAEAEPVRPYPHFGPMEFTGSAHRCISSSR